MKIILTALNAKYVHSNLAVYDLMTYAKDKLSAAHVDDGSIEIVVNEYTINHNLDQIMQSLYVQKADVIAFSCYIWNISEILTIARELKKVLPDTLIWVGGPEVSYNSIKLLEENEYLSGVIRGEGEETFYELAVNGFDNLSEVYGITYRDCDKRIVQNLSRPLLSMDEIPFIYRELSDFENKILYYESSRGCPFSCSYCLSSIDKSVRFRSLTMVKKELAFLMDNRVSQVKFIDRTFNCDKNRARQIWEFLKDNDNGVTNFHFEISADLIEEKDLLIFEQMRPGLIQLEIGLQTTNEKTIKEIRRSMDIQRLKSNMLRIRKMRNIHQHLDLIAGLPYEDYRSFINSFNDAYCMQPDQLQLGFLKVLKGSYMEEMAKEYGLLYSDEQPYEVLSTKWISYEEIIRLKQVEEMVEVYYNSDQFEHVLPFVEAFFDTPFDMYAALSNYYLERALYGIGLKRETRYTVLRDFFMSRINEEDINENAIKENEVVKKDACEKGFFEKEEICGVFDSLLSFDYYLRENVKTRPVWSREFPIEKSIYNQFFINGGNEEYVLKREGYDSKIAARSIHIEPVVSGAVRWINKDIVCGNSKIMYAVFDYSVRNPLSNDASYRLISTL